MRRRIGNRNHWLVLSSWMLLLRCSSAHFGVGLKTAFGRPRTTTTDESTSSSLLLLRGGGSHTAEVQTYRLKQQLYLQTRSMALRQALIDRGLAALSLTPDETVARPMDWECSRSTPEYPKRCLYTYDAEMGSKVIGPLGTPSDSDRWITLRSLNRLRRTDPTKVEPLWHNQYPILSTWMSPAHKYSLYHYLSPTGALLSWFLDTPGLLALGILVAGMVGILLTLPVWEGLVRFLVTSQLLWSRWPSWGRFVHANLPLKLFMGQIIFKFVIGTFAKFTGQVRTYLVEMECDMLEMCLPLTVIDGQEEQEEEMEEEDDIVAAISVGAGSSDNDSYDDDSDDGA